MDTKAYMEESFAAYGLTLPEEAMGMFMDYIDLLLEWNGKINLTAIIEKKEIVLSHFIDSLILIKETDIAGNRIIDIGSGAGFPGMPLKIACSNIQLTLLDSLNKRIVFLDEIVRKLALDNVHLLHGRAEDAAKQKEYREAFDISVSRAVAKMNVLAEYCIPFVRVGGMFVAYKGYDIEEELEIAKPAIIKLGGQVEKIEKFRFGDSFSRSLVFIRKRTHTPPNYPRKPGNITKKPLI